MSKQNTTSDVYKKPGAKDGLKRAPSDPNKNSVKNAQRFIRQLNKICGATTAKTKRQENGSTRMAKPASAYNQNVVVKMSFKNMANPVVSKKMLKAHIDYILRDGTEKGKESTVGFNGGDDIFDKKELEDFTELDCERTFRIILSAENGHSLDLTEYGKDVVGKIERDLGYKFQWIAANHYNTDNPHTHILIKGIDAYGKEVIIPKEYVKEGLRNRASEIATDYLGHRTKEDIANHKMKETDALRFTSIDRKIINQMVNGAIEFRTIPTSDFAKIECMLIKKRLKKLVELDLVTFSKKKYLVPNDLEIRLRAMSEQNDIIKALYKSSFDFNIEDTTIYDVRKAVEPITGIVIDKGYHNESCEIKYMVVQGEDGKAHYVKLGRSSEIKGAESGIGNLVKISPKTVTVNDKEFILPNIKLISAIDIERQIDYGGITFLDRLIATGAYREYVGSELKLRIKAACEKRIEILIAKKVVLYIKDVIRYRKGIWEELEAAEAARHIVCSATGRTMVRATYLKLNEGDTFAGKVKEIITCGDGNYGIISNGINFIITPIKPGMALNVGTDELVVVEMKKARRGYASAQAVLKILKDMSIDNAKPELRKQNFSPNLTNGKNRVERPLSSRQER